MHTLADKILLIGGIVFVILVLASVVSGYIDRQKKIRGFRKELEAIENESEEIRAIALSSNSYEELTEALRRETNLHNKLQNLQNRAEKELR
jgi:hypothetical protein